MTKNEYIWYCSLGCNRKNHARFRFWKLKIAAFVLESLNICIYCQTASKFPLPLSRVALRSSVTADRIDSTSDFLPVTETTACTEASKCWHYCVVPSVEAAVAEMGSFSPPLTLSPYLVGFATAECGNHRHWCSVNSFKIIFCSRKWRREF